eukprot:g34.t1
MRSPPGPYVTTTRRNTLFSVPDPDVPDTMPPRKALVSAARAEALGTMGAPSARWCAVSRALWCAIVPHSAELADLAGLRSFLDVLRWRADGTVTEPEFVALHQAWKSSAVPSAAAGARSVVRLPRFQRLLLKQEQDEAALDLMLALLINEDNRALLGGDGSGECAAPVTRGWLAAAQELFFALDVAGYGYLGIDEARALAGVTAAVLAAYADAHGAEPPPTGAAEALLLRLLAAAGASTLALSPARSPSARRRQKAGAGAGAGTGPGASASAAAGGSSAAGIVPIAAAKHFFLAEGLDESQLREACSRVRAHGGVPRLWDGAVRDAVAAAAQEVFAGAGAGAGAARRWQALERFLLIDAMGWLAGVDGGRSRPAESAKDGALEHAAVQLWTDFSATQGGAAGADGADHSAARVLSNPFFRAAFDALSRWHRRREKFFVERGGGWASAAALEGGALASRAVPAPAPATAAAQHAQHVPRPAEQTQPARTLAAGSGAQRAGAGGAAHASPAAAVSVHVDPACYEALGSPWPAPLMMELAASAAWANELVRPRPQPQPSGAGVSSPASPLPSQHQHQHSAASLSLAQPQRGGIGDLHGSAGKRAQDLRALLRQRSFETAQSDGLHDVLRLGRDEND